MTKSNLCKKYYIHQCRNMFKIYPYKIICYMQKNVGAILQKKINHFTD